MKVYARLLTVPTSDTPGTAVLVHFDDKRYVFGHVAEGSQRAFMERHARLSKVQDIFLTGRTEWASMGGLVGFLLTVGDQRAWDPEVNGDGPGPEPMTVHGGENLLHFIAATRTFVFRGSLKMVVDELRENTKATKPWKDNNVTVTPLHIRPEGEGEAMARKRSADKMEGQEEKGRRLQQIVEGMFAGLQRNINKDSSEFEEVDPLLETGEKRSRVSDDEGPRGRERETAKETGSTAGGALGRLPSAKPSPVALSYIMKMHDHRGRFLPGVAKELGVKPGPNFRILTSGLPVATEDGRMVYPHQVMEPTRKGTGIAVCDLPGVEYISEFVSHREWSDLEKIRETVGAFFWILAPGVAKEPRLQEFMKRFPDAKHIIASTDVCPDSITFNGSAKFQTMLNHLDPLFFVSLNSTTKTVDPPDGAVPAQGGLQFEIEPKWALDDSHVFAEFDAEKCISAEEAGAAFTAIAGETRDAFAKSPPGLETFPGSDVEVYTLGTGSALPSRYRNVSGTLITIPDICSVLLDCGENTVGQMKRVFPPQVFSKRLLDIRALYISHLHADHHLGSVALLKEQRQLLSSLGQGDRKTYIVAPHRFWIWLNEYSSVEYFGLEHLVFIPNEQLRQHPAGSSAIPPSMPAALPELLVSLQAESWVTAPAFHCQSSFTTAITFSSGFKLAYSGDTRPTTSFVEIGRDATLLVHEATFDDELQAEAVAKKHSTIGEAIQAGRNMGARKTALIHFSQRYPKAPVFGNGEEDQAKNRDVLFGFDYMRFKVGEVARFPLLMKGVEEVYRGESEENVD